MRLRRKVAVSRQPNAAAKALISAAKSDDVTDLIAILGPASKEILTTNDPVADQQMRRKFVERAAAKMKLVPDPKEANAQTLLIGKDEWPLPIPIVKVNGEWHFDVEQGKQEILARRIGSNELDAIEVCRGYVEAQNDYAEKDRTGSGVLHYAQKIISSPGEHDGLYWTSTGGRGREPNWSDCRARVRRRIYQETGSLSRILFQNFNSPGPARTRGRDELPPQRLDDFGIRFNRMAVRLPIDWRNDLPRGQDRYCLPEGSWTKNF